MKKSSRKSSPSASSGEAVPVFSLLAIPLPNGLFAAVWVLSVGESFRVGKKLIGAQVRFLVLEGTSATLPTEASLASVKPAKSYDGDPWKGVFFGDVPVDFARVGTRAARASELTELTASKGTMVFQDAEHLRRELFGHWRLEHDRPALEEEWRKAGEERARREAERRASSTLPGMLREKPFAHWREHWPAKVVREATAIFAEATARLVELEGGTKRERTKTLKGIVTRFNDLYGREGCIETGEASEIIARVTRLAELVGLSNEDEALTGHRDW